MIIEAFILGITNGFGPCTMSCAPVLVPLLMTVAKNFKQGIIFTLLFSLGRIITYIIQGVILGALGNRFDAYISNRLIGIALIALGVMMFFRIHNKCLISRFRFRGSYMAFVAGIVMGFSPCAPLLAAFSIEIASKSAMMGGILALAFGIGTTFSPILLLGLFSGKMAEIKEFADVNNYVAGGFLVFLGIAYIFL